MRCADGHRIRRHNIAEASRPGSTRFPAARAPACRYMLFLRLQGETTLVLATPRIRHPGETEIHACPRSSQDSSSRRKPGSTFYFRLPTSAVPCKRHSAHCGSPLPARDCMPSLRSGRRPKRPDPAISRRCGPGKTPAAAGRFRRPSSRASWPLIFSRSAKPLRRALDTPTGQWADLAKPTSAAVGGCLGAKKMNPTPSLLISASAPIPMSRRIARMRVASARLAPLTGCLPDARAFQSAATGRG